MPGNKLMYSFIWVCPECASRLRRKLYPEYESSIMTGDLKPRFVKESDEDYPLAMTLVPNREQYSIMKLDDNYFVPLFQVIDLMSMPHSYGKQNNMRAEVEAMQLNDRSH